MVDAAFTRADGHRIVAAVLDSGKSLTTVVITAGDPDFYFGAEVIADAFPGVRFVAPADVIEHIQHSYEGKLAAWAHLGANLPTRLVEIEELTDDDARDRGTADRAAPRQRRAGRPRLVPVRAAGTRPGRRGAAVRGVHVWTADSATPELRAEWIRALDELEALEPTFVAAGHRVAGSADRPDGHQPHP